ncbi:conserved hypothetical protein [Candidatus Nitrotoga sp. BS]|uniref:hypothetical protein n=1 Tax=Candidatus Nitrotoga sp. BS TaxID=2890408 RepID=UPI001EF2A673|nr:hypothetical protein [Candidatus Nitrotoga sp. BS]CAH1197981.1 conserved hypothetical protein [Candidatus Nitrotoga sp. BS]
MTINLDQNDEIEKQQLSQDVADKLMSSGESRRRFATSGLAVSGIILTLASRPVLGQTFCMSPSGFISGNTSQHGACPVPPPPVLLPPDPNEQFLTAFPLSRSDTSYNSRLLTDMLTVPWPTPQSASAIAPVQQQVQKDQLGAASYMLALNATPGSNSKLSKGKGTNTLTSPTVAPLATVVVEPPPFQTQELLQHLVKALLRARNGATPYLTVSTIQSMFYEWQASGTFAPTAGVTWNATQIIEYLRLTQN